MTMSKSETLKPGEPGYRWGSFAPAGLFKGAGIPTGPRVNTFIECGCCGHYHREDFRGDCREDSERYTVDQLPDDAELIDEED